MNDMEKGNIYSIPPNYTDSGKILGGMLSLRNAIETLIIVLSLGFLEYTVIPAGGVIRVIVMAVTLIPVAILAMTGINGDSLFTFVSHMVLFLFKRRKLTYERVKNEKKKKG